MRTRLAIAALALVGLAAPVAAHHGWSGYDASRLVQLEGTVQAAAFDNPHAQVTLRTEERVYRLVLAPPSRMQARGLPAGSIKADDRVTVEGYPHRQEADEFRCERIMVNGGQPVELR